MAKILANGLIQFKDGRILYCDTLINGCDFIELIPLLSQIDPVLGRSAMVGFPFVSGGGGGVGPPGPPGPPGPGSGIDLFAATRIVSLDPTQGTDTTIQGAIDNLPAEGGKIFIKQGSYSIVAPILLPDGKSVLIQGAGKNATTITLITPDVPLFVMSAAATGIYGFRDFTATGDGVSDQDFLDVSAGVDVAVEGVNVLAFRDIADIASDPEILFRSCAFAMPAIAGTSFWRGADPGLGHLTWLTCEGTLPVTTTSAIDGQPQWNVTDSYVGGPGGQSVYSVGVVVWQGFALDRADVRIALPGSRIVNLEGSDTILKINNTKAVIANSTFITVATTTDHIRIDGDGVSLVADVTISGCTFDAGGLALRCVSLGGVAGPAIADCVFRGYTDEAILFGSGVPPSKGSVTGCRFEEPGVPAVNEPGTTQEGRYSNNTGFGGSTIAGTNSLVENENYRNVRTWGAVGDGVTDDSPAIQAAVDALPARGGVVYFPPGRYFLDTPVSLPDKPIMLLGAGASVVSPVGASVIDLEDGSDPAFTIAGASFLQSYTARDLGFLGEGNSGQHAFEVSSDIELTVEDCEFAGINTIFNCTSAPLCEIKNSLAFPVASIFQTTTPGAVLNITDCLFFLTGAIGVSGDPSVRIADTNINGFVVFTMDLGAFSVMNGTRVTGATVNANGGNCRFEGYASDSSLLDLTTTANNVISGALIETAAVGIAIGGLRNTVDGCRFNAVAVPISEVGAADFNLYDGINGFAGSVIIGGSSVVGDVIA